MVMKVVVMKFQRFWINKLHLQYLPYLRLVLLATLIMFVVAGSIACFFYKTFGFKPVQVIFHIRHTPILVSNITHKHTRTHTSTHTHERVRAHPHTVR